MVKVGVIGATGYTGEEIIKILARHKNAKITLLQAIVEKEEPISSIFPSTLGKIDIVCQKPDWRQAAAFADVLFLALPHKISMAVAPVFLKKGKIVIDLSADYRLSAAEYEKWYGEKHRDAGNINRAVYGLPEFFRKDIKKARLLANPGCYPTGATLAVAPAVKNDIVNLSTIIIDSKSGATGAGRKAHIALSFSEINENVKAYKINEHQHKPEISMVISRLAGCAVPCVFVPHLIPVNRGILTTVYMDLKDKTTTQEVTALYKDFYRNEPFVNVMNEGVLPALRDVQHTNFCNIGLKVTNGKLIVISTIDNLLKGAAGQAVQNMNIMCGFDETEGLL
ncbi:MAG: N-acetyl-gamma-glutamyl-phosphate reductase [Omnitrophica bacterium]|nr:N-acetyl-gamma-glutamyl-phosphate reductase [Candidatus Omnitrophota bacterium]